MGFMKISNVTIVFNKMIITITIVPFEQTAAEAWNMLNNQVLIQNQYQPKNINRKTYFFVPCIIINRWALQTKEHLASYFKRLHLQISIYNEVYKWILMFYSHKLIIICP